MCLIKIILAVLVIIGIWYLVTKNTQKESYGGNQNKCEEACFSSQYYDACMNECMTGSDAGWTGRPDSYQISALEAPEPLDEETGQQTVSFTGPYRYDYPGH